MISIIHPSRGRHIQSVRTTTKWLEMSNNPENIEIIVCVDADDPQLQYYIDLYIVPILIRNNKSSVEAINFGATGARGDILMVVGDDQDCFEGWDVAILKEVEGKNDWILKTHDGIQKWIITMPIMDRAYYNRFHYIYHPSYKHLFCDTELTCVADITGRKLTSNLTFPHNHYSIGKSPIDEIYRRNDATNSGGERVFIERYKRNFDLPKGNKIEDRGMIDWLLKKNVA